MKVISSACLLALPTSWAPGQMVIHLPFIKYWSSIYHVPGMILGPWDDATVNRGDKVSAFGEHSFWKWLLYYEAVMIPINIKPEEMSGSEGNGTLAQPVSSSCPWESMEFFFCELPIWTGRAGHYFCPRALLLIPHRSKSTSLPWLHSWTVRKAFLFSLLPVSLAVSWGSVWAIAQVRGPTCASSFPPHPCLLF